MIMKLVGVCRSLAQCLSMFIYTFCLPRTAVASQIL